jgi:hypothetical protein
MKKVTISFGVDAPRISEQLKQQGLTARPEHLQYLDVMAKAMGLVEKGDFFTAPQIQQAEKRLLFRIKKISYPMENSSTVAEPEYNTGSTQQ